MNISPGRLAESAGCPADIVKIVDHHDPFLNEFHFDRRSQYFEDILGLYHTGSLHMSLDGCRMAFMEELEYWEIDEMLLANCCHTVTCHQCSLIMTSYQCQYSQYSETVVLKDQNLISDFLWHSNIFLENIVSLMSKLQIGEHSSLVILAVNANLLLPTAYFVCRNT